MKNQKLNIDHINLSVENLKQSLEWYQRIFHFQEVESGTGSLGQPWSIVRNGDNMIALTEYSDRKKNSDNKTHQIQHFGLRLSDKKEWEKTIEDNELKLGYGGRIRYPHSYSYYVQDPTGHEIEVAIWDNNEVQF